MPFSLNFPILHAFRFSVQFDKVTLKVSKIKNKWGNF